VISCPLNLVGDKLPLQYLKLLTTSLFSNSCLCSFGFRLVAGIFLTHTWQHEMVCPLSSCSDLEILGERCFRGSKIYILRLGTNPKYKRETKHLFKEFVKLEHAILTATWKDILERFNKTSQKLQVSDLNCTKGTYCCNL